MPIAIACPSCGHAARVPDCFRGQPVRCRKCQAKFTVSDSALSSPPKQTNPRADDFAVEMPLAPAAAVQPPTSPPVMIQASLPPLPDSTSDGKDEHPDRQVITANDKTDAPGVVSLIFGSLSIACLLFGCFTCGITYYVAIPFALVGSTLGFWASGSLRVAGITLNLTALIPAAAASLILATGMGAATMNALLKPEPSADSAQQPSIAFTNATTFADTTKPSPPIIAEQEWLNAGAYNAQLGEVRIRVANVRIDFIELADFGRPSKSAEKLLRIELLIENLSDSKKLDYRGWHGNAFLADASLTDNFKNRYRATGFGVTKIVGQIRSESVYPGKSLSDVLVFEAPVDKAEFLRLELDGANIGETGKIRFEIPEYLLIRR